MLLLAATVVAVLVFVVFAFGETATAAEDEVAMVSEDPSA